MKQKLSGRDYTYVASMLFGMFFGAGNLFILYNIIYYCHGIIKKGSCAFVWLLSFVSNR